MIRKGLILVILLSMVLHCASRVGFLSYLYQQRQEIAYALGIIKEIPIALCSSEYDFSDDLVIHTAQDDQAATNQTLPVAPEIKLFFSTIEIPVITTQILTSTPASRSLCSPPLDGCLQSIFHPPAHLF